MENVKVINWTRENVCEWLVDNKLDSFVEVFRGKLPRTTYVISFRDFTSTVITVITDFFFFLFYRYLLPTINSDYYDEFINLKSWCCAT